MKNILETLAIIFFLGLGIFQVVMGYQGIEYHLGIVWAIIFLIFLLLFRFTLPITIGSYFGIVDVLEWHWAIGLLLAVPGLIFLIPGITLIILNSIRSKLKSNNYQMDNTENN